MKLLYRPFLIIAITLLSMDAFSQEAKIYGTILSEGNTLQDVKVELINTDYITYTNTDGKYELDSIPSGKYKFKASDILYKSYLETVTISSTDTLKLDVVLEEKSDELELDDVVISGTMKAVSRDDSPVPVEVYTQKYFKKNPTPSMFEALQNINGVRPQINCSVCNTGDIHINGLEGPYTMVLIDGMPIVSSLGTVYGLSGIPNSLIERIEVVKGPASSLYGSEAVGGLINVITKKAENAKTLSADLMVTSWEEINADLGIKFSIGEVADVLTGLNYFTYQNIVDNNNDHFTDVTLQDRYSIFQKWNFNRKENRLFSLALRYLHEDRWGGDVDWNESYRGGDEIYGESIYTKRYEVIGNYQLPVEEKMFFNFSYISHDQDSRYGTTSYIANQKISFGQFLWDKKVGVHDMLSGVGLRYSYYDDNTAGTRSIDNINEPDEDWLPGIFFQDEITLAMKHRLLLGVRYDYNNDHGNIFTPRLAYKWTIDKNNIFRLNTGTGFRVVNLFTEDHAALTGSRDVVIEEDLKPEKSYNANLNYIRKIHLDSGGLIHLDGSLFYTYFNNRITPDYETNTSQIIYKNLNGHAISKGISLNANLRFNNGLTLNIGGTLMDNTITDEGVTREPLLTEHFMGIWAASYKVKSWDLAIDYTGNVYSPMKLPLLGDLDPRLPESPWWSLQNIQLTYDGIRNMEIYGGVKNLLNWTPNKGNPFIIPRTNDPFDKDVKFDDNGDVVATPDNPYALTFDPAYVYGPNQGIRTFIGIRYNLR